MKELKNKKDIEFIEKELFKQDKIEIFCKTSLILSSAMFFLTLLLLVIQIIFKELTQDSIIVYAILLIISGLLVRHNNIKLEKNRHKLVMKFIEEDSKKSR